MVKKMTDKLILGICPTCYLTVTSDQANASIFGSGESVYYHRDCEPNRMKYMKSNADKWKDEGEKCKKLREEWSYTVSELAEYLGVSETKIRKFESGKPVTHAKLLSMAYINFFKLVSLQVEDT
jgi:DNA-binding XRE family transcriptional regulator